MVITLDTDERAIIDESWKKIIEKGGSVLKKSYMEVVIQVHRFMETDVIRTSDPVDPFSDDVWYD